MDAERQGGGETERGGVSIGTRQSAIGNWLDRPFIRDVFRLPLVGHPDGGGQAGVEGQGGFLGAGLVARLVRA